MKHKFLTLLFAIVAGIGIANAKIAGTCGSGVSYSFDQETGELTITGNGAMGDFYNGASPVAPWWGLRDDIKSAVINEGVTYIGNNAFSCCQNLISVAIPSSVTEIGEDAFSSSVEEVHISDIAAWCIIYFHAHYFIYKGNIYDITYNSNPLVNGANLYVNDSKITDLKIPNSVSYISTVAFYHNNFTSVTIPNSVKSIGEYAFENTLNTIIYCESAVPASIQNTTFPTTSPIYVPQCAYTTYQNASIWKDMTLVPVQINMQVANNEGGVVIETCGSMEIEAIPFDGYHFKKWLDGSTVNPRTYSLSDKNLNFIAQFEINKYTITLNCDENQGSITGDQGKYNYETDHTIEAVPNYGYHFTQWSDGETENPRVFTLVQDTTFTALFAPNKYTLTIQYDNTYGSVEGDQGSFDYLSEHEIQVNAKYGYHFTEWSDGVTDNPRTLILTKDTTITASFAPNKYQLELIADAEMGAIEGEQGSFDYLSEHEITAIPNTGYLFSGWSDGATENPRTITLTQDTSITALFEHNLFTVTLLCDENQGSVSKSGDTHHSGSCTITATPNYGYHFTQWTDGDTNNPRTFIVTQDTTFTAEFAIDKNGTCGDELALTWTYDDEAKELTISGAGSLNNNYTFGVEAPTSVEKVIFDEGVTSVGNSAFANYTTLEEIHLASTIKKIYEQAFYNCENLVNIYCYRDVPCVVYNNTFDGIDKFSCTLHVPGASIEMYKAATGWRDFYYVVALPDDPTGIDNTSINQPKVTKVLRDNHILILRGDNTYTLTGQKMK